MPISFIITVIITAISLIIISKLPFGVAIDSFPIALVSGFVLGLFNAIAQMIPGWVTILPKILTLGLFSFIINVILFGLAAWIVPGFRLRSSVWSAILGNIFVSLLNSILGHVLSTVLTLG